MAFPLGSVISAAGSIVGNLIGGSMNKNAQGGANDINLRIARETNQQQYQMFQEQNAFNERMYNEMQDYNTPAAQMQRYRDAGINPYIAAGNVQTGNAQSSLQSAPAPQMNVAQVSPETGLGSAVQSGVMQASNVLAQFAQNELALSQASKNRAEAGWIDRLNGAQLSNLSADTIKKQNESSLLGTDYQIKSSTLGNYIRLSDLSVANAEKTNEQLDAITQSVRLENALKNINLGIQSKHGEDMFKATLAKTIVEAFALKASVRQRDAQIAIDKQNANTNAKNAQTNRMNANTNAAVGIAQIKGIIAGAIKTAEETTGIKIDNHNKQLITDITIQGLRLDNQEKANKSYIGSGVRSIMESGGLEGTAYSVAGRLGWLLNTVSPFGGLFKK